MVAHADESRTRQVTLPSAPRAAGRARQEVRDALASWGLDRLEDTAVLLTSELVGNAVRHADNDGSELELRVTDSRARLRIEVVDADPHPPQLHLPAELDESGFGFVLVDALAANWGVDQATAGKTVWIELNTGRPDQPAGPPSRNQASVNGEGVDPRQVRPPGRQASDVIAAASDEERQATGTGGIPAAETASVCRSAAALIHGLGWDPLAESWNEAGPLPMDVAIFSVTEARGYEHPDDILDTVLTHIAGLLYAVGEATRQTLVHDMTDVAMAWEARPGRTADEVLAVLDLTASILNRQVPAATQDLGSTADHSHGFGQKTNSGFVNRHHHAA